MLEVPSEFTESTLLHRFIRNTHMRFLYLTIIALHSKFCVLDNSFNSAMFNFRVNC